MDEELVMRQQAAYGTAASPVDEGSADRKRKNVADVSDGLAFGRVLISRMPPECPSATSPRTSPTARTRPCT